MTLTFPTALDDLPDCLRVIGQEIDLGKSYAYAETGGGEIVTSSYGTRLWSGSVTVSPRRGKQQARGEAVLRALRMPGREILVGHWWQRYPDSDPDGSILSGRTVGIEAVNSARNQIRLNGLPPGYLITPGDYFSFAYDGRQAFHQVVSSGIAGSGGITPMMDVVPTIKPYTSAGNVALVNPEMRAIVVPGSTQIGQSTRTFTDGFNFRFLQTLRA